MWMMSKSELKQKRLHMGTANCVKDKILALVMSPVHLSFNKSQEGTYQNTCIIQFKYHVTNNYSRGTC